jgi:superfamily II RNA helicase
MERMEEELAEKCDPAKFITPNLAALQEFGFLGPEEKLTPSGVMATEVNEGHSILMPLAYTDPTIRSLLKTKEDIVSFLAIFLGERGEYNGMEVGGAVRASLRILNDIAVTCKERERRVGASSPYNYWDLKTDYVEIIWRFVNGEDVGVLLQDYELFGGNFTRLLSKMVNIVREWTTLATLSSDTDTLTTLEGVESLLTIGAMSSESLYLRLV